MSLAGDTAAQLLEFEPGTTRYVDDSVDEVARRTLDALGPRVAELLVAHEERETPTDTDEAVAWEVADAFAGSDPGMFYLEWLRAEARTLVIRYRAAILRVADALERQAVRDGPTVVALVGRRE